MPRKQPIHVMSAEGGWVVERGGAAGKRLSVHRTQAEAELVGRDIAKRNKTDFLLHGRNGQIRKRGSYSH